MKLHRWDDVKKHRFTPAQIARLDARVRREVLKMDLAELRKLSGHTQVEISKVAKIAQSELSRVENSSDHLVSTLRRYVEALGGELEVAAVFGKKRITLTGV